RHVDVLQLDAFGCFPQQQAAAAHIASAHEVDGKSQTLAEDSEQDVDVLRRGDAAEQDNVALGPELAGEGAGAPLERAAVPSAGGIDVNAGKRMKRRLGDQHVGTSQASAR